MAVLNRLKARHGQIYLIHNEIQQQQQHSLFSSLLFEFIICRVL